MTSGPVGKERHKCANLANNAIFMHRYHSRMIFFGRPYLRSVHVKSGLVPSLLQNHVIGGRERLVGSRFTHLYCSNAFYFARARTESREKCAADSEPRLLNA